MSQSTYNADSIEVLSGLEPVRRRPGMYTDTTRPNHLGQEVIDNSVDEALAGHAKRIEVILHEDQSLEVIDDGRGMPVDIHAEEGVPAVELIFCRLHAGGKFSNKNYQFSGGLHGVGISVVNALSKRVEVAVKRGGEVYEMAFENGDKVEDLHVTGTCGKRNTGTSVHFWPDVSFFDSPRFSVSRLSHLLKAKAVLCPGAEIIFKDKVNNTEQRWCYEDGLTDYLMEAVNGLITLPEKAFVGAFAGDIRKLRQPDPNHAGRYARQRSASGAARCDARVLRIPQYSAARRQAFCGRYLGTLRVCAFGKNAGSAICRSDQGASLFPSVRCVCFRRGERCLQPVAEPECPCGRTAGRTVHFQRSAPFARRQKSGA
jgi:hypothetical protein